jgi:hypothetical protein
MNQDGGKSIVRRQPQKGPLSGYHFFMDRLRSEGKLYFWCACGEVAKVKPEMPMRMRCFCDRQMVVMDMEDLP